MRPENPRSNPNSQPKPCCPDFSKRNNLLRFRSGRVLDRDKILDEIAGRSYDVFDRSIDVHISSLRKKLGDDFKNPRYIKTIRSVGYMLVPQTEDEN